MTPSGGGDALDRLVAEHIPHALRFAIRLTGCVSWAEEIVQEALYRAVRSRHTFRGQSQFRTWLFRIVVRAFYDSLNASPKNADSRGLADEPADPRGTDPAAALLADELSELIAQRVSALPPRQREVLVLIAYEQRSPREVAEILDISESSVHANLHYARSRLRAELAPYLAEK